MSSIRQRILLRVALVLLIPAFLACAGTADRLIDRAARAGEREAGERIDRGVDAAADTIEDAVTGGGDAEPARSGGGGGAAAGGGEAAGPPLASQGADVNFDFTRGERPLFSEDYSGDNVGDFPRNLTLVGGNWEVVEWEGRRFLRGTGGRGSSFQIELPESLPERFTIEFDVMFTHTNQRIVMATSPIEGAWRRYDGTLVQVENNATGALIPTQDREMTAHVTETPTAVIARPTTLRLMVDGEHAKVYFGNQRVANIPNALIRRSDRLHFQDVYMSRPDNPIFFGPVRVDAGGRDLYSEIEREGRVAVRGILFDTDSEGIRLESRPVLDEIGTLLREHPDLSLSIEGHTDSQGPDEYNRDLSQRRAESVREWLVAEFGIDPSRLSAVGMGESRPVASNETADGRQQNRRVELVRTGG